jgi:glycosyltransferase involved in cell wall biosynthesis
MSLAVLEAMATGLPAVGSKVIGYIVEEGQSGYLIPEGSDVEQVEACRKLLMSTLDSTWEKLGSRAREIVVERFSWDTVADRVCQVYLEAVANHRKGKT